jgi:D-amino-acid oxidase
MEGYGNPVTTTSRAKVLVLGAGVSGLTVAMRLVEADYSVRVLTDRLPWQTTSAVAGAIWGPYVCSDPRVLAWSMATRDEFERIAKEEGSGVQMVPGLEASTDNVEPPMWTKHLPDFERCPPGSLSGGFVTGWRYSAPVIDMPVHLRYLTQRLESWGVRIELLDAPLMSLAEIQGEADIVVNCTGLGARDLVPDPTVYPTWGQLVVVENPGIEGFFSDYPESATPTYFMSQGDSVVLGGVIAPHVSRPEPEMEIAKQIIARCAAIEPSLATATVREHRVGERPCRSLVRLERVEVNDTILIHNYGHGGSGITIAWGCADSVLNLVKSAGSASAA